MPHLQEQISLLWPPDHRRPAKPATEPESWWQDLGLDDLVQALDYDGRQAAHIRPILAALCTDTEVIRYRQEVFADVSGSQGLQRDLAALLPALRELDEIRRYSIRSEDNELLQVVRRLRELELYVEAGQRFLAVLESAAEELHARGLRLAHLTGVIVRVGWQTET